MQQRYYDPIAGRFLSVDPVTTNARTGAMFNRYEYANNNPYRYFDPDGRCPASRIDVAPGSICGGSGSALQAATASIAAAQQHVAREVASAARGAGNALAAGAQQAAGMLRYTPLGMAAGRLFSEGAISEDKPKTPGDVLAPNGQPVGQKEGSAGPGVRTVTPGQLDGIVDGLKGLGATPGSRGNYPGDWYDLPNNQGGFGVRDSRGSGRTVDVNIPGVPDVTKIHQKP